MSNVEQWEHNEQRAMETEITTLREQVEKLTKVCESKNPHPDQWSDMSEVAEQRAVTNCAEAIRARMKP